MKAILAWFYLLLDLSKFLNEFGKPTRNDDDFKDIFSKITWSRYSLFSRAYRRVKYPIETTNGNEITNTILYNWSILKLARVSLIKIPEKGVEWKIENTEEKSIFPKDFHKK